MLFSIFYECVMLIGFLLFLPRLIYQRIRYGKYRTSFLQRFGVDFPKIERTGPVIWVHAVSVGECQAVKSLVLGLKEEVPHSVIVVSSITETGHAEAKRVLNMADYHVYLPYDFYLCTKKVLSQCSPDVIILSEGDFWYRFLHSAKRLGSVILVVNGKISNGSERRLKRVPFFTKRLLSLVDFFCVQSDLYKDRFRLLGVPASKMSVTGNLKCDAPLQPISSPERDELLKRLHITPDDITLVIGSTHDSEEELLLQQIAPLFKTCPNLKVLLVPRHPERFSLVQELIQRYDLTYGTWSGGASVLRPQVMLIDAMGLLRKLYQVADVAIVAGSFTSKVGGHNILEAQAYGVPVMVGPYMQTQSEFVECSKYFDAIVQVENHEVGKVLEVLLNNPARRKVLSVNSLKMYNSLQGATEKTMRCIYGLIPQFFH